jgi:hypothetical protein
MIYHFDSYHVDVQRGELRCVNHPVEIEPQVFDVLVYLLEHRDRIVTKEELLEHCWAGTLVSEPPCWCPAKAKSSARTGWIAGHQDELWSATAL